MARGNLRHGLGLLIGLVGLAACAEAVPAEVKAGRNAVQVGAQSQVAAADLDTLAPPVERIDQRVRVIAERWIGEASRITKGKANTSNVHVAVHVVEATHGTVLASLNANRSLRPASNMKLVTTAAALFLLGSKAEFITPIEARGEIAGGRLAGDLIVRASGDPFWDPTGRGRIEGKLRQAAREVAQTVRLVEGDLILDQGRFLDPEIGPAWPDATQHWAGYCARSSGFTLNGGVLIAEITPRNPGQAAKLALHPVPTGLEPRLGVETTRGGRLDVRVGATTRTVTVRGKIPSKTGLYRADFAHPDPVKLFRAVWEDALAQAGVRIEGETRIERRVAGGTRIAELRSSVAELMGPINADSENGVADQLFFALGESLGGGGTRDASRMVIEEALISLGASSEGFVQVDGSGLSRSNRVTALQLTRLLAGVLGRADKAADVYLDSLAVMGQRGTLEDRLNSTPAEGRVFAKTGWIGGTSALSGVVRSSRGPDLVFSILVQYPASIGGLNNKVFKRMQDELCLLFLETQEEAR